MTDTDASDDETGKASDERLHDDDNDTENESTTQQQQCHASYYFQLGAPAICYRNRETYTVLDEDPRVCNASVASTSSTSAAARQFLNNQSALHRSTARWYYPIDFHVVRQSLPPLPATLETLCQAFTTTRPAEESAPTDAPKDAIAARRNNSSRPQTKETRKEPRQSTTSPRNVNHLVRKDSPEAEHELPNSNHESMTLSDLMKVYEKNKVDDESVSSREEVSHAVVEMVHPNAAAAIGGNSKRRNSTTANLPSIKERNDAVREAFSDFSKNPVFGLQLHARAHMLLATTEPEGVATSAVQSMRRQRDCDTSALQARQKLLAYTQLDGGASSHVPAKLKLGREQKRSATRLHRTTATTYGLESIVFRQTQLYDRERRNRADPAYLAPFHGRSLRRATRQDIQSRFPETRPTHKRKDSNSEPTTASTFNTLSAPTVPGIPRDDPNAPHRFGNCLVAFPCRCGSCSSCNSQATQQPITSSEEVRPLPPMHCLLHPVGPLQDRVRLSFMKLPRGVRSTILRKDPRSQIPEEIDIGYRLRQLIQCGDNPYVFVARTDLHCTVFSVTFVEPTESSRVRNPDGDVCWGTANLTMMRRLDCRTLVRGSRDCSLRPTDMTCHPRYGSGGFTPCNVAIAYESSNGDRNAVHRVQVSSLGSTTCQKHVISNLQDIFQIEFSSFHPMVLWSAARSYVRPALTSSYSNRRPKIGHGSSLYSIDLRLKDKATFQWSPSAQEFLPEGIHCISGLYTDWSKHHCVWVSSVSAGKTWEIDTRMPCRAVNTWSLPHMCDQMGASLPPTGGFGGRILFSCPQSSGIRPSVNQREFDPMLGVGTKPGHHGLHLYQRPLQASPFHMQSVEVAGSANLSGLGNISAARSSVFPLPDVSENVFTCGLATFRSSSQCFGSTHSFQFLGFSSDDLDEFICAVTLTNKGDVYAQTLVESKSADIQNAQIRNLPLGSVILPAPDNESKEELSWNEIPISTTNQYPVPSSGFSPAMRTSLMSSSRIDLSTFVDRETKNRKRKAREEKKRNRATQGNDDSEKLSHLGYGENSNNYELEGAMISAVKTEQDESINGDEEQSYRVAVQTVARSKGSVFVSSNDSTQLDSSLTLPNHLTTIDATHDEEHFSRRNSVVEDISSQKNDWRSDLTPSVFARVLNDLEVYNSESE